MREDTPLILRGSIFFSPTSWAMSSNSALLTVFEPLAARLEFLVDLDGLLSHHLVRVLGAADEEEIVALGDALVAVGIQAEAEQRGLAFGFFWRSPCGKRKGRWRTGQGRHGQNPQPRLIGYGTERMRQKLFVAGSGALVKIRFPKASARLVACGIQLAGDRLTELSNGVFSRADAHEGQLHGGAAALGLN